MVSEQQKWCGVAMPNTQRHLKLTAPQASAFLSPQCCHSSEALGLESLGHRHCTISELRHNVRSVFPHQTEHTVRPIVNTGIAFPTQKWRKGQAASKTQKCRHSGHSCGTSQTVSRRIDDQCCLTAHFHSGLIAVNATLSEAVSARITLCLSCCSPTFACPLLLSYRLSSRQEFVKCQTTSPGVKLFPFPLKTVSWRGRPCWWLFPRAGQQGVMRVTGNRGKASGVRAGLCVEGVREHLGILRPRVPNEVRKHPVHCQGAQFVLPGRVCLFLAAGGGAIRSTTFWGFYMQSLPPGAASPQAVLWVHRESSKRMQHCSHHNSCWRVVHLSWGPRDKCWPATLYSF